MKILQKTRGERFGTKTCDFRYELTIDNKSEGDHSYKK